MNLRCMIRKMCRKMISVLNAPITTNVKERSSEHNISNDNTLKDIIEEAEKWYEGGVSLDQIENMILQDGSENENKLIEWVKKKKKIKLDKKKRLNNFDIRLDSQLLNKNQKLNCGLSNLIVFGNSSFSQNKLGGCTSKLDECTSKLDECTSKLDECGLPKWITENND